MLKRTVTYPRLTWLKSHLRNASVQLLPSVALCTELEALLFKYLHEVHGTFSYVEGSRPLRFWLLLQQTGPWSRSQRLAKRIKYLKRTKVVVEMTPLLASFYDEAVSRREKEKKK